MPSEIAFAHLHCHTHYSLLDGAGRIDELVLKAKKSGTRSLAITDHGNLFGAVEFYTTALREGIRPVLGCEVYMAARSRWDRDAVRDKESYHLILLAQNNVGYANLMKLVSLAYQEGFYRKPRVDKEILSELNEGLICTTACLAGETPQALVNRDHKAAREAAETYLQIFGPDRFFIELQDHGLQEQRLINPELSELAQKLGVGLLATNDVHYLDRSDAEAHDVLCCINTGRLVKETDRFQFPTDQFYLKTPEEMRDAFAQWPESIDNTERVAEMCHVDLRFNKRYPPVFRTPDLKDGTRQDQDEYLRRLCEKGMQERYGDSVTEDHRRRLETELKVIADRGYSGYFLIVWDFVRFARQNHIPCGARGSAVGTMVGYLLRLSHACPLEYDLLFERFMDPSRNEMPDIDIDICQDGRAAVIDYVREKYGHVAQIVTYGTLKARAAIRDVGRVLDVPLAKVDSVAKLVPERLGITLQDALREQPDLKALYDDDNEVRRVIDLGRRLEGLARHTGIHAAGVVIADRPLTDLIPLFQSAGSGEAVTQYDGPTVEKCGLLKMDFLGLRTLSVIERARRLIEETTDVRLDFERLDLNDEEVYELFAAGESTGIFQFESAGMRDVLRKMKPTHLDDLIAANALYRPGPMELIDTYVARKHGQGWENPHPIIEEITRSTYGIMIYQEQVMRVFNRLGGIELAKAYKLIKAISKKQHEVINAMRPEFIEGGARNGLNARRCEELFELIMKFAGYGFNKSHSTGYAILAYQTAYLKVHFPVQYMAALLTYEMGETDKVVEYIEECRRLKVAVAPPDVNSSSHDFTAIIGDDGKDRTVRFGLGAIKGVGGKAVEEVIRVRNDSGEFRDLFDFCERVDLRTVNRSVIDALIKCGAFDSTHSMRRALSEVLDKSMEAGQAVQRDRQAGQMTLFGSFESSTRTPARAEIPEVEWTEPEMLAYEKATLGFYVTSHPLSQHAGPIEQFATATTRQARQLPDNAEVVIGGMITRVHDRVVRQGKNAGRKMANLIIEDLEGSMEAIAFSEVYEQFREQLAVDKMVFLSGQLSHSRDEPAIRIREAIPIDQGPQRLARGVVLNLSNDSEKLESLAELLRKNGGPCPVFLSVMTHDGLRCTIRTGRGMGVRPTTEFFFEAEILVGHGNCRLIGNTRSRTASRVDSKTETEAPYPAGANDTVVEAVLN
jgi:DNA polymerase-3 subunit alpha